MASPLSTLSVDEVVSLIGGLGLDQSYEKKIRDQAIDGEALDAFTEADLVTMGVSLLGHRKKILNRIARIKKGELSLQDLLPSLPKSPSTDGANSDGNGDAAKSQPAPPPRVDYSQATDGTRVIADDPYLEPYVQALRGRYATFTHWEKEIAEKEGSLARFAEGYKTMGLHRVQGGILYTEWAPRAHSLHLVGDFNGWNRTSHPCSQGEYGKWTCFVPDRPDGTPSIAHGSKVKVLVRGELGERMHIPPWIHYAVQVKGNIIYDGVYWDPPEAYVWKNPRPPKPETPLIYEAHVGMSGEEERIATYDEFRRFRLPYIASLGYNTIQLMAIMEHTYYASFGYQITSFFACSSRFGTPEDLKALIDDAHALGLIVLLDVVHSHASKNVEDGLNYFDESDGCHFHAGSKGTHAIWDSRLFNYDQWEVLRFLLSNLRWWVDEYHFDGFRFDGVTTMILMNRAVGDLPTNYDDYFGAGIDVDALRYLTLANKMLHDTYPFIITIAEDACGMPTLCRPTAEGGVGFDYRLAMGLPEFWKKQMLISDEHWEMGKIAFELTNRRWKEKNVAYVESHDQALVGDKTIAFWLMDKEMYTNMSLLQPASQITDRGMQLHKLLRLVTLGLAGEGYLTFMGNEFGHPEWIDFPRAGNNESFHYCRRRWSLAHDHLLRYQQLLAFDRAMIKLERENPWMNSTQYVSVKHEGDKVLVFERGPCVFAFNFHPTQSYADYRIPVNVGGPHEIVLDTDRTEFGGHNRIDSSTIFLAEPFEGMARPFSMLVYLPCRTATVFRRINS